MRDGITLLQKGEIFEGSQGFRDKASLEGDKEDRGRLFGEEFQKIRSL